MQTFAQYRDSEVSRLVSEYNVTRAEAIESFNTGGYDQWRRELGAYVERGGTLSARFLSAIDHRVYFDLAKFHAPGPNPWGFAPAGYVHPWARAQAEARRT